MGMPATKKQKWEEANERQKWELASKIIGRLPAILENAERSVVQGFIDKPEGLVPLLSAHFSLSDTAPTDLILLHVDYSYTVEFLIQSGNYDWKHSDVNSKNFTKERAEGAADLEVTLFHYGKDMSTDPVLCDMEEKGFRPLSLKELLALGAKYPELQRKFPLVELGSVWQHANGNRDVACLVGNDADRNLDLLWGEFGWSGLCRFPAVRLPGAQPGN